MANIYLGEEFIATTLNNVAIKDEMSKKKTLKIYLMRASMSGIFLASTYLVYLAITANFTEAGAPVVGKFLASSFFSLCLFSIYVTKSELLTSNMMILTVGKFFKKITLKRMFGIMGLCLFGNFLGGAIAALLISLSTLINQPMSLVLEHLVEVKLAYIANAAYLDVLIRAIFCNFFINIAMLMIYSGNLKSDFGKFLAIYFGVFLFVYIGLEHSVANMVLFSLAYFYDLMNGASMLIVSQAAMNLLLVLIGNFIGGGLFVGLYYSVINNSAKFKK